MLVRRCRSRIRPRGERAALWLAAIAGGLLVVLACGGKQLSLGGNVAQSQAVALTDVSGLVGPCATGFAHPNVCCLVGGGATSCLNYPSTPFQACQDGATTYPDPRACCPLAGGSCVVSPTPPDSNPTACVYACPIGSYAPAADAAAGECCSDDNGATACGAAASSTPSCPPPPPCPTCTPDAGPCPPCPPSCPPPSPPPPPLSSCPPCPAGWSVPDVGMPEPELCCRTETSGASECFSQGVQPNPNPLTPPQPTPPPDAGVPTFMGCAGTAPTDSGMKQCSCQEMLGSTQYSVSCTTVDGGIGICTCMNTGGATQTTFMTSDITCANPQMLFAQCGYPPP